MSGLAQWALDKGMVVSGSDRAKVGKSNFDTIDELLIKKGARIIESGHKAENITNDLDLVVYSAAIPDDNPELVRAGEMGIKVMERAEFLGLISREYYTIAVSGTHGKTTTSAMITKILKDAGMDPTALVGSVMSEYGSNYLQGGSKYLVVEACEYERQFLRLSPQMIVITNIEADHLDYYKDLADVRKAFAEYAAKIPEDGVMVCRSEDAESLEGSDPAKEEFTGLGPMVDYSSTDAVGLNLRIPGKHNVENAKAALAVAEALGVSRDVAISALNDFRGTARRFEYKGQTVSGAMIYDDYAHHPTEIMATLAGAKEMFPDKRIVVVFQPHLYSRTRDFLEEFAVSFKNADEVIVADIYPAREKPGEKLPDGRIVPNIHARELVDAIKHNVGSPISNIKYLGDFEQIAEHLQKTTRPGDVIITMGAGDIYKICQELV